MPIIVVISTLFFPIGMYVSNTLGSRTSIFIGGSLICASITATSYTNLPIMFFILYAVGFGVGKGFIYPAPLRATWSHLPGRKGLVSGVITAGLGFGAFIYGLIINFIVNPNNIKPIKTEVRPGVYEYVFSKEVSNNVPKML